MYESVDSEYVCMDSAHSFVFSAQSIVPMGCYSTHILLDSGTTIVNLAAIDSPDGENSDPSNIVKSLQHSVSSISSMNLWPTFNCAFATMVHAMEKLMKNFDVQRIKKCIPSHSERKSALILVSYERISVSHCIIIYFDCNRSLLWQQIFSSFIQGGGLLGLYGIILLKHHFGEGIIISCCDVDEGKRDVITRLGATFIKGIADE